MGVKTGDVIACPRCGKKGVVGIRRVKRGDRVYTYMAVVHSSEKRWCPIARVTGEGAQALRVKSRKVYSEREAQSGENGELGSKIQDFTLQIERLKAENENLRRENEGLKAKVVELEKKLRECQSRLKVRQLVEESSLQARKILGGL